MLILHGTADKVTKPEGSQLFYATAGSRDKTLKLYDGHAHDLLNDIDGKGSWATSSSGSTEQAVRQVMQSDRREVRMFNETNSSGVKNVVLVHGGFVDGSGWRGVYDVLRNDGYTVSGGPESNLVARQRRGGREADDRRAGWTR